MEGIVISINAPITPAQLFDFYERNQICEVGSGPEVAARVLEHSALCVAAEYRAETGLKESHDRACHPGYVRSPAVGGRR